MPMESVHLVHGHLIKKLFNEFDRVHVTSNIEMQTTPKGNAVDLEFARLPI